MKEFFCVSPVNRSLSQLSLFLVLLAAPAFSQSNTFPASGNVGIGTTTPLGTLQAVAISNDIVFSSPSPLGYSRLNTFNDNPSTTGFINLVYGSNFPGTSSFGLPYANLQQLTGYGANALVVSTNGAQPLVFGTLSAERARIDAAGNVGIGTTAPTAKLEVNGNIKITGDVIAGGNIAAKYQDIAEWVPAKELMVPGTVVVLNPETPNQVMPSDTPYDTRVAGVVSAQPGLILGEAGESKAQIATTGRVRVKASTAAGRIDIGDLLVTGENRGVAMKSMPLEIGGRKFHQPGTIIGKALEPLVEGEGEILVLLSMQ